MALLVCRGLGCRLDAMNGLTSAKWSNPCTRLRLILQALSAGELPCYGGQRETAVTNAGQPCSIAWSIERLTSAQVGKWCL